MEERILAKLDEKFHEMKEELKTELSNTIREEVRSEVSAQMFVFEEEYGRKINIMYEELTGKIHKERNLQEDIAIMERRIDKNSDFVFHHEKRITTLERQNEKI